MLQAQILNKNNYKFTTNLFILESILRINMESISHKPEYMNISKPAINNSDKDKNRGVDVGFTNQIFRSLLK